MPTPIPAPHTVTTATVTRATFTQVGQEVIGLAAAVGVALGMESKFTLTLRELAGSLGLVVLFPSILGRA